MEVYTPAGSWSSYPPHKHDVHRVDAAGKLLESDLEETYFYKFDRPEWLRHPACLHLRPATQRSDGGAKQ
ncbi:MAG: 5-deoxy-glucuronate isomerase [Verrucomicrobiota bacterium]